jgi:hypothetical protein
MEERRKKAERDRIEGLGRKAKTIVRAVELPRGVAASEVEAALDTDDADDANDEDSSLPSEMSAAATRDARDTMVASTSGSAVDRDMLIVDFDKEGGGAGTKRERMGLVHGGEERPLPGGWADINRVKEPGREGNRWVSP